MVPTLSIPLEDELGDVLEKAMSCAGFTPETLSEKAGVSVSEIRDAVAYMRVLHQPAHNAHGGRRRRLP